MQNVVCRDGVLYIHTEGFHLVLKLPLFLCSICALFETVCMYVCTCACACACVCVCLCSKLYPSLPRLLEGKESMAKSKVQTLLDHTLSTAPDLNSHLYTLHRMDS